MKKEAIVLKYSSTRGNAEQLDSAQAIIRGLAADGGLFVPDAMPKVDMAFIEGLKTLSYEERAEKVLGLFLTDYTAEELSGCVTRAYGSGRFDTAKRPSRRWATRASSSSGTARRVPSRTWRCSSCRSS